MKKLYISFLFLLNVLLSIGNPGFVLKQFKAPGKFCTGLTYDGRYLWVADRETDLIYKVDTLDGHILKTLAAPAYWTTGLAWDGKYLWAVDERGGIPKGDEFFSGYLYMIDTATGKILHATELSFSAPQDITFEGNYLWLLDKKTNKLVKINPYDGTSIIEYESPAYGCTGLCFDGKYLWVSNNYRNEIYMVNPADGSVIMILSSPDEYPRGMAYDGKYLWLVDSQTDMIYKIVRKDKDIFTRISHRTAKLNFNQEVMNFGPGMINNMDMYIAIPQNLINQDIIGNITYSQNPDNILTDKWGQKVAHFYFENIKAGEKKQIGMQVNATMYDVRYFIFPEEVGTIKEIPKELKKLYLEDEEKYDINNAVIKNAVMEAVGSETNVYWIVRNIYFYVHKNLDYERVGGWNTAPTVLSRGSGSCSEYSFVFISMCRNAGVPARYVGSVVERGETTSMDEVYHRWVEVYMPNYGWIPVDPSGGDEALAASKANCFGHISKRFLITTIGGGNSEYLDWNYNSNIHYTSDPKTFVVTESYGDWDVK